ncbi:MAG: IS21 family transposase [Gammaproteobacteria bacterium]
MLTVDEYEIIRRKHRDEGLSQRQLAHQLGHSRKTIKKALELGIPPGYRLKKPRSKPTIEPYANIIDQWLEQNKTTRHKQRMIVVKMYERLCDEYKFTGHYSTVARYINEATARKQEVFMPLAFEPGQEAQVDWHEAFIYTNGMEKKVYVFCMKLCFSKAPFVFAYESMQIECFLDGHVRAFEYFSGIPRRIAYDNLKTAVTKILLNGNRKLNKRFKELRSFYLFDTRFCNVARGNEKGDVENLAKRSERQFFSPIPDVCSMEELNAKLLADCEKELSRKASAPHAGKTVNDLFEEEKPNLYELPQQRFEACRRISTFPDKQLLIRVDTNRYSVPVEYAYQQCLIKVFVDKIEIYCKHELKACHKRSFERERFILDPLHYIRVLERKPGCLDNARPFKGQPWGEDFERMRRELEYRYGGEGTSRFIKILLLFSNYPEKDVRDAVGICVRCRAFSDEAVVSFLRNGSASDFKSNNILVNKGDGKRDLLVYNNLITGRCIA